MDLTGSIGALGHYGSMKICLLWATSKPALVRRGPLALASTDGLIYQVTAIVVVLAVMGTTHREAGS